MKEQDLVRKVQAGELASNNGTVIRTLAVVGSDYKIVVSIS